LKKRINSFPVEAARGRDDDDDDDDDDDEGRRVLLFLLVVIVFSSLSFSFFLSLSFLRLRAFFVFKCLSKRPRREVCFIINHASGTVDV